MTRTGRYDFAREEMLAYVPEQAERILDVGCASGLFAKLLTVRRPGCQVWGIDPDPPSIGTDFTFARRLVGDFPDVVPPGSEFDCIVFNDVLEHMIDPWAALRATLGFLGSGATVVASIPNIRHRSVLQPLMFKGAWTYKERGILDRTHLRFFTKSSILSMFQDSGFVVKSIDAINIDSGGRTGFLNRVTRGRLVDFLAEQFAVVATPVAHNPGDR